MTPQDRCTCGHERHTHFGGLGSCTPNYGRPCGCTVFTGMPIETTDRTPALELQLAQQRERADVLALDLSNAFALLEFYGVAKTPASNLSGSIGLLAARLGKEIALLKNLVAKYEAGLRQLAEQDSLEGHMARKLIPGVTS